jgi:hypothetical protein
MDVEITEVPKTDGTGLSSDMLGSQNRESCTLRLLLGAYHLGL